MLYSLRNYTEIAYLVLRKEKSIDAFMYRFELSKYEFKSDFQKLKEMEKNYGIEIRVENETLIVDIEDYQQYLKKYRGLFSFYYNHRYIFNDNDFMICYYLIDELLHKRCVVVEEYANDLGYSKSAIRSPLKKARNFIESFGLKTINKPYYGLCLEGNELDIRRCLSAMYSIIVPEIIINYPESKMNLSHLDYTYFYQIVFQYCSINHISMDTEDNKRICYYLAVSEQRMKDKEYIAEINIERDLLEQLKTQWELKKITVDIFQLLKLPLVENEIYAFMLQLFLCERNYKEIGRVVDQYYQKEKTALQNAIYKMLKNRFDLVIDDDFVLNAMNNFISILVIKYHSNEIEKQKHRLTGMSNNVYSYPLCYFINESVKEVVCKFYNKDISASVVEKITDAIFFYIEGMDYCFKKAKIAISIRSTGFLVNLLKRKIEKEIDNRYIDSIDIVSNIELLNHEDYYQNHYDLILTDINLKNHHKTLTIADMNHSVILLEQYLRMNRDLCKEVCKGQFTVFSKTIRFSENEKQEEQIAAQLQIPVSQISHGLRHHFLFKDTIIIMLNSHDDNVQVYLGDFETPLLNNKRKISRYVIFKGAINRNNIRIINIFLHEFAYDRMFVLELVDKPEASTINNHLNQLLK